MTSIDSNQHLDKLRPECAPCNGNHAEGDMPPRSNGQAPALQLDGHGSDDLPDSVFEYSRDVVPVWSDNVARFRVGSNEYWLHPAPQRPDMAMELVIDTITALHSDGSKWLPLLLESGGPVVFTLRGGPSCTLNLSEDSEIRHISVEYEDGIMTIHFPPIELWKDVSLDWMIDNGCPCGYLDCHPVPWHGTSRPFSTW